MAKYYTKQHPLPLRQIIRYCGLGISVMGLLTLMYYAFPLLSWQLYLVPALASDNLTVPIPKTTVMAGSNVATLVSDTTANLGVDYSNANNWFPTYHPANVTETTKTYQVSIPAIKVYNAEVSAADTDLDKHFVHYGGTPLPPHNGNAVIFGHSTLPQLFDPHNYKTLLANAHTLKIGDTIIATIDSVSYQYKIYTITIVDADDPSMLDQDFSDSFLTLVTCTPPGTTWKRLVIRARLEKI